ncbi:MAG TPA: thioredoxin domain-containing protein [Nitrososphaerales archaeon]|nr:thioredoxin domain-containing protein [Nitrososphaerales archaeon]
MLATNKLTSEDLYKQFQESLQSFKPGSWTLALFEGSPAGGLYSWCPDCVVASTHIRKIEAEENGNHLSSRSARLLKFKVGSKREWESKRILNPFKANFPHLSDVPTAILFFGRLDVLRIIAPREADLRYMLGRTIVYEDQVKSKDWHPPVRYR